MRNIAAITCLAFGLSACGGSEAAPDADGSYGAPTPTHEAKVSLSMVEAESVALAHVLSTGRLSAEQARGLHVGTLPVLDVQGEPTFYLVSFADSPSITTPWTHAAAHAAELAESKAGSMVLVGASNEQEEVELLVESLSLLGELHATLTALGGEARLNAVVSLTAGLFLLRDVDGSYWDVSTQTLVAREDVAARAAEVASIVAADADGEIAAARVAYAARRHDLPDFDFGTITRDGHLDPGRAIALAGPRISELRAESITPAEVERQGAFGQTEENCKRNIWGKRRCDLVEEGEIDDPETHQGHYPRQPRGFSAPRCIGGRQDTDAALGCGPAAVVSWVWMAWKNRVRFPALAGLDASNPGEYMDHDSATYETFSRQIGQDLMNRMNTCSFGDKGSMTLPNNLVDGANSWLASQGVGSRMHIIRHGNRNEKAQAVHTIMGMNNRAMIAGFDLGFASAHWSPVARYRIVRERGAFAGGPKVSIKSLDHQDRWYGLYGTKLLKSLAWIDAPPASDRDPNGLEEGSGYR